MINQRATRSISEVSPQKRALLEKWRRGEQDRTATVVRRRLRLDRAPLTFAQERMWFLEQLEPGSPAYNMVAGVNLLGPVNLPALEQSFDQEIRRQGALRTSIRSSEAEPEQLVSAEARLGVSVVDLTGLDKDCAAHKLDRLAHARATRVFDLGQAPLMGVELLRSGETDHALVMGIHHIVSDGWSMGILVAEIAELYRANVGGGPACLPDLNIDYCDFAAWQRERFKGPTLDRELSYWREQLTGVTGILDLPADRPRPAAQTYRGATEAIFLNRESREALENFSGRQEVTLFITLLAAFAVLLHRHTGECDICIGTPISGRTSLEVENLVGLFMNTLVLRAGLSGDPSFRDLVGRIRQVMLAAHTHQHLPFEKLVEAVKPQRDMSRNPLFQVMFTMQNLQRDQPAFPGIALAPLRVDRKTAKLDLMLSVSENNAGLIASFEYATDLFDATSIKSLASRFLTVVEGIGAGSRRLSELPWLSHAERHQVLAEFNDSGAAHTAVACIHELIEASSNRKPDAVSVAFGSQQLSYRGLWERADRVRRLVAGCGAGPGFLVGVMAERSLEMIVALIGVLESGAAYVPLDPHYPADRLDFIVEDAGLSLVLTQSFLQGVLTSRCPRPVFLDAFLDSDLDSIPAAASPPDRCSVALDGPAYVIYTSGSTGRPKGVKVTHRSVANFLNSMSRRPGLGEGDTLFAVTSFSFDIAALEIFLPLALGARVVLAGREATKDGGALMLELAESAASVMQATPSTWRLILQLNPDRASALKPLCGGEALPPAVSQGLVNAYGCLWNLYGPTETTIWSSVDFARSPEAKVTIGRPIDNTEMYIVDEYLDSLPIGLAGEIVIGGLGVAAGYLGRPDLTAERFIPDSSGHREGARVYRSGDRARYLSDGRIDYLCRLDHQVKIRGFRIEPGEIECVLSGCPSVREAAVVAMGDAVGETALVAFVVAEPGTELKADDLRKHLRDKVPEFMVPSDFVMLEEFPLTPNRKVDRLALLATRNQARPMRHRSIAPRDVLELRLSRIFEEVLGTGPPGVTDDFFDLGGHSLLAMRLAASIRKEFGREIPLAYLFQRGSVARLAETLRREGDRMPEPRLLALRDGGARPPFFCIHEATGSALCYLELARGFGAGCPFYALHVPDGVALPSSVEEMAALYIAEIRSVQSQGPYLLGGWSFGGIVAFEMSRQLQQDGQEVAMLALMDTSAPAAAATGKELDDADLLSGLARINNISLAPDELRGLGADEMLERFLERIGGLEDLDLGLGMRRLRRLLQLFRASHHATRNYRPRPYAGAITLFRADGELPEHLRQTGQDSKATDLGWSRLSNRPVEIHGLSGNHFTLLAAPHVQAFAEQLEACLNHAAAND
jgi:amino acid adenylation domain-containing protein